MHCKPSISLTGPGMEPLNSVRPRRVKGISLLRVTRACITNTTTQLTAPMRAGTTVLGQDKLNLKMGDTAWILYCNSINHQRSHTVLSGNWPPSVTKTNMVPEHTHGSGIYSLTGLDTAGRQWRPTLYQAGSPICHASTQQKLHNPAKWIPKGHWELHIIY